MGTFIPKRYAMRRYFRSCLRKLKTENISICMNLLLLHSKYSTKTFKIDNRYIHR